MKVCPSCCARYAEPALTACPKDGEALYPELVDYAAEADALVGRLLDRRYLLEALLGEGGMGLVVRARHLLMDRRVAIKLLHPELLTVRAVRERFRREAEAAAAVRSPHVVSVLDFGVTDTGLHYLVMEFLEGCDLGAILDAQRRLPVAVAIAIARPLAAALSALHAEGFVHRDLKPENIWVERLEGAGGLPEGVKLLDFGIAGLIDAESAPKKARITRTGLTLGTPYYMSPEQVSARPTDARSDIYALGCVLHELLSGFPPFDADSSAELMRQHLVADPPPPSSVSAGVPPEVDAVVLRCLAKHPDERYPDAASLLAALDTLASLQPSPSPVPSSPLPAAPREGSVSDLADTEPDTSAVRPAAPRRLALLGAALALAGLTWALWPGSSAPADPPVQAAAVSPAPAVDPPPAAEAPPPEAPAAEAPPPEAPAAEAPPETITLDFRIEPEGASIYAGETLLGSAPLAHEVLRDADATTYRVALDGHLDEVLSLSHGADQLVRVRLSPAPRAPSPRPRPAPRPTAPRTPTPAPEAAPKTSPLMRPASLDPEAR